MSDPARPAKLDDALLSGLDRLRTTPLRNPPPLPSPPLNIPYAYFPPTPSPRRTSLIPRSDLCELVEHATGLARSDDGDLAVADKLLSLIRAGSAYPADVLRAIVAGTHVSEAPFNARVLVVLHWLCAAGGPLVLPAAVHVRSPRRPSAGGRVCVDVLKSVCGGGERVEEMLHDDDKVREMNKGEVGELRGWKKATERERFLVAGVEAYAIALGRKMLFHNRYPEVEANYSLDRHFRKMHIENRVDRHRAAANMERHGLVVSKVSLVEVELIVRSAMVAAERLERAGMSAEVVAMAASEACNAWAFAEYVRGKIGVPCVTGLEMGDVRERLGGVVGRLWGEGGGGGRALRRFVEGGVLAAVGNAQVRAGRPESRHRREIVCTFSSFEAMHMALRPDALQGHRGGMEDAG